MDSVGDSHQPSEQAVSKALNQAGRWGCPQSAQLSKRSTIGLMPLALTPETQAAMRVQRDRHTPQQPLHQ